MKALRIISRNIRDSFKGVFRNFSLSLASISCITITLLVVSIAIILSENVNTFASNVENDVTIVAFLNVDINQEQTSEVANQINKLNGIDSVEYMSKTEIAKEMMDESEVFSNIMSDWKEEDSPLQATYQVKVKNIDDIGDIANKIKKIDQVSTVKYGEGMVEQLVSVFDMIKKISIGMVIALVIVTAFLISNTIKITIFSRKREIEIMRLVGASNINIKIPFIIEGLILGLIGSVLPIIFTTYGYTSIYNYFGGKLFTSLITLNAPNPFIYKTSGILIIIGIAVGMYGSWKAVRKYLKI